MTSYSAFASLHVVDSLSLSLSLSLKPSDPPAPSLSSSSWAEGPCVSCCCCICIRCEYAAHTLRIRCAYAAHTLRMRQHLVRRKALVLLLLLHLLRLRARIHTNGKHKLAQPALGASIFAQARGESRVPQLLGQAVPQRIARARVL